MIQYDLSGKTALVTGGASGIGLATVRMLGQGGATVAVNYLPDDPRGAETVARLKADGLAVIDAPGDVSKGDTAVAMVNGAVDRLGRLDLLVNNAGTPGGRRQIHPRELDLITDELWETVIDTNLLGTFRCSRAAADALRAARGAIVNLASVAGINAPGSSMAYGATKAGIISLTKNFARALAPEVRVNAVAPGSVDSDWQIEWTQERRQWTIDNALLKRRCTPEDIAEVIVFLGVCGAMVTAQTVVVDGGLNL